ncbi:putative membrane protein [Ehrlichia chaffeensis str. Liberty]|uniref:Uncharacterized protein n=1 Tax=Ehrlichia chaffeensis (strain ATCC CRL-10679 / Arkansas) TaxID=205920 RepID=Q2GFV1_EHRCR|nr:hypothetical protein ECH_0887 [Ehrlichia chaffeensis str. Arkansas]AHX06328.1 putative membrane protein [Ehrlichia chaffeensis str. Liberty]AHX07506.1 putative membrane protein [Ehrlichia chaffeensis str. Osceola]AHX09121.1 putative membrane protein [Ehrlichia chaffeensis str. Wakulla]
MLSVSTSVKAIVLSLLSIGFPLFTIVVDSFVAYYKNTKQ